MNEAQRAPYVDWRLLVILAIGGLDMNEAQRAPYVDWMLLAILAIGGWT
jgi:hypothetical protein